VSKEDEMMHYLVQVQDSERSAFRGLRERSSEATALIPRRLFTKSPTLTVRVLASSGIATGSAMTKVELEDYTTPEITLTLLGADQEGEEPPRLPSVVSVLAVDSAGVEVPPDYIRWYDETGNLIGKGREVDLRGMPLGTGVIRAVARGHGGRTAAMSWMLERAATGVYLHATVPDPARGRREAPHQHPHRKPGPNRKPGG
jgi:hypothetical protein